MQRLFGNQQGVTLIEQLVAALLGLVMIGGLCGFYRDQLFYNLAQQTKTATLEDARGALDIMARDLKNAGSWATGAPPAETGAADDPESDADGLCNRVYAAAPGLLHVQMDLNGNNNCADSDPRENVRYELAGPTATCPGSITIRRNGDCLAANITTPAAGKLFSYFDNAGVDLGDTPPRAAIKRVRIAFAVVAKHPDPRVSGSVATELSTSVELRN
jgi:type II secretory pathway component PulJ